MRSCGRANPATSKADVAEPALTAIENDRLGCDEGRRAFPEEDDRVGASHTRRSGLPRVADVDPGLAPVHPFGLPLGFRFADPG